MKLTATQLEEKLRQKHGGICIERRIIKKKFATAFYSWQKARVGVNVGDEFFMQLERGCYEKCCEECLAVGIPISFADRRFVARYSTITARIGAHLLKDGSIQCENFIHTLISGAISPSRVAYMTSAELCPDVGLLEREIIAARLSQKIEKKISLLYTCPRCQGKRTSSQEYSSCGGDEGLTTSTKCEDCAHVWRQRK